MSCTPDAHPATTRPVVRRRDGLALAVTGEIPDRVYDQVLAEHRAERDELHRIMLHVRINRGSYPLPIPYGYHRINADLIGNDVAPANPESAHGDRATTWTGHRGHRGWAPAVEWWTDDDAAATVRLMTWWVRDGVPPTQIAARLNAQPDLAPLRTLTGHPRPWSGRAVATLLTDPVLTGHGVWGRTHHGRPQPRDTWIISATPTHPPILDPDTHVRMVEILTAGPATPRPGPACSARTRWRR